MYPQEIISSPKPPKKQRRRSPLTNEFTPPSVVSTPTEEPTHFSLFSVTIPYKPPIAKTPIAKTSITKNRSKRGHDCGFGFPSRSVIKSEYPPGLGFSSKSERKYPLKSKRKYPPGLGFPDE